MPENVNISDELIGKVIQERYKVVSRIGEGGMGVVYEVEHVLIGRRFALKTLSPLLAQDSEVIARFHREARAAATIGDKHIIEVNDMGRLPNGSSYIVLELLEGNDLANELDRIGPLPISRAIKIATQCCHALGKAHEKGIVHRDIKPDNIYLDRRQDTPDFVKILDFGISKVREAAVGLESGFKTKTGTALGTPYYMSPEQAIGETVDHRTDIYALGVVLFQILIGRVPFVATTYPMLVVKIIQEPPPSLTELRSDIPLELEKVIHRAMAKNPKDRFGSMEELVFALSPFTTLSGKAQLTDSGVAFAKTMTPTQWEGRTKTPPLSTRDGRLPFRKAFAYGVPLSIVVIAIIAASILYNIDKNVYIPPRVEPTKNAVNPPDRPNAPIKKITQNTDVDQSVTDERQENLPRGKLAPSNDRMNDKSPPERPSADTNKTAEKSKSLNDKRRRDKSIKPNDRGQTRDRRRPSLDRRSSTEKKEPTATLTPTRSVLLINQRRAGVEVTLICGTSTTAIDIAAKKRTSVAVPQRDCRVSCKGLGQPRCPITLRAIDSSLEIR